MNRRYWQNDSGCRDLVLDVEHLCEKLRRPVCSKDLQAHYREFPEERPLLTQALGQLLLKATYPRSRPSPTLIQIGILGYHAYYALDDTAAVREGFRVHSLRTRISEQLTLNMPLLATELAHTAWENFARNALAGFIIEWQAVADEPELKKWRRFSAFQRLLALAERNGSPEYISKKPNDWLDRKSAVQFIRDTYTDRYPDANAASHNVNRHLATLRWPQSALFEDSGEQMFSSAQLAHYCHGRWPLTLDEKLVSQAVWRCATFGTHGWPEVSVSSDLPRHSEPAANPMF